MRQKGFAPILVIFVALLILGSVVYVGVKKSVNLPSSTETPIAESTESPTISPKSSPLTTTPKPTIKPTPVVIIDNSFVCGKYDSVSHPPLPSRGSIPLLVSLSPSGGPSGGVSLAGWQWDYDGNGIWDTDKIIIDPNDANSGYFLHTYTTQGTFHPKFRVVGANGAVGPTCSYPFDVVVGKGPEFQNDIIAIDKLSFEYTVSKSKENFSAPWYMTFANDRNSLIYMPAFNVSSKNKFTYVSFKESLDQAVWFNYTGYNLRAGTSYDTYFVISKSQQNGTYEGTRTVTYTIGDGTLTKEGPTIHYKITLTD